MNESSIMRRIQVAVSQLGSRLFRNNVGILQDRNGVHIRYGLCTGSADLVGWTPVLITGSMVGSTLAVFTAIEVKTPIGKVTKEQQDFLTAVNAAGGIGFVARSEEEALSQLQQ